MAEKRKKSKKKESKSRKRDKRVAKATKASTLEKWKSKKGKRADGKATRSAPAGSRATARAVAVAHATSTVTSASAGYEFMVSASAPTWPEAHAVSASGGMKYGKELAYGSGYVYASHQSASYFCADHLRSASYESYSSDYFGGEAGPKPLEVVAVCPCLVRGGAEQWLVYLTRFLDPDRVRIVKVFVTRDEAIDPVFARELSVPIEWGTKRKIRKAARRCDLLVSWGVELDPLLAGQRSPPTIFVAHGEGAWTRVLLAKSLKVVDHVVAVSQRVKRYLGTNQPVTVIPNGVDTSRLGTTRERDATRARFGFAPDDFVLGYVGRFSGEKRAHLLIDAAAQLPKHFKVLLVGWGADQQRLMNYANAKIPGRFAITTACDYLGDVYRAMDAFCLLSCQEGSSLALLEAMICECPVIATPVGSAPELIVDRVNGLLVKGSGASTAHAAQLLEKFPDWSAGLAAEAKQQVERTGHAFQMAKRYEKLFLSIVRKLS